MAEPYTYEQHSFTKSIHNYKYCSKCGIVALKNSFTEWAIKKGCNSEDHPEYKTARSKSNNRWW
jgi:hypothetical protein